MVSETFSLSLNRGGAIPSLATLRIATPSSAETAIGTNIGLLISNQFSGNRNYAIFSEGGDVFVAGKVGFGTLEPEEQIDLDGAMLLRDISQPLDNSNRLYSVRGDLFWNGKKLSLESGLSRLARSGDTDFERATPASSDIAPTGVAGNTVHNPQEIKAERADVSLSSFQNNLSSLIFKRSGGNESNAILLDVNKNPNIGSTQAFGFDGKQYILSSQILFGVDAPPGTADMPGNISFWTTPDGLPSPRQRMIIRNTGFVGIGTPLPFSKLDVKNGNIQLSNSGEAGELRLNEPATTGGNYSAFKAQMQTQDITYTLPGTPGRMGQVLANRGGDSLLWIGIPDMVGGTTTLTKSNNQSVSNSTALQDDDELYFQLQPNEVWIISGVVFADGGEGGLNLSIAVDKGDATVDCLYLGESTLQHRVLNTAEPTTFDLGKTNGSLQVRGVIRGSESARTYLRLRFAQARESSTPTTVKKDSFITLTRQK